MPQDLSELRFRLRTPGVWVHHLDYSRAEPAGYVRDSAPFEAADAMDMQALQIAAQAAEIARLQADATAHAMQYISLTDAMGYTAGPQGLSPEEFATALRVDAERWQGLLRRAIETCEGLAEQQAMRDDWYVSDLIEFRAALSAAREST